MELMIVIAVAIVAWAAGSLWYMPFAGPWVRISSVQVDNRGGLQARSPIPYLASGVAMVVFVGMMRYLWLRAGIDTLGEGLLNGLMVGAFIILPWTMINYTYARPAAGHTVIAGGYVILAGAVAGAILGAIGLARNAPAKRYKLRIHVALCRVFPSVRAIRSNGR